jgi:hypothetical protein
MELTKAPAFVMVTSDAGRTQLTEASTDGKRDVPSEREPRHAEA